MFYELLFFLNTILWQLHFIMPSRFTVLQSCFAFLCHPKCPIEDWTVLQDIGVPENSCSEEASFSHSLYQGQNWALCVFSFPLARENCKYLVWAGFPAFSCSISNDKKMKQRGVAAFFIIIITAEFQLQIHLETVHSCHHPLPAGASILHLLLQQHQLSCRKWKDWPGLIPLEWSGTWHPAQRYLPPAPLTFQYSSKSL